MIDYRDDTHTYSYKNTRYLSATQVLDMFKNPFDAERIAIGYAKKHGQTPKYWLKLWEDKRNKALERGDRIHSSKEEFLSHRMIDIIEGRLYRVHNIEMLPPDTALLKLPDGVYPEMKLWHHGYHLAGRADKVILETIGGHRFAHIDDYKTNESIDIESHYFEYSGQYKMMRPPISHLMDCSFIHYSLQLSLYMFMLEYMGFKPGKMQITHYPHPQKEGDPEPKPIPYPVQYHKREVISMLNYAKRRKEFNQQVGS